MKYPFSHYSTENSNQQTQNENKIFPADVSKFFWSEMSKALFVLLRLLRMTVGPLEYHIYAFQFCNCDN